MAAAGATEIPERALIVAGARGGWAEWRATLGTAARLVFYSYECSTIVDIVWTRVRSLHWRTRGVAARDLSFYPCFY